MNENDASTSRFDSRDSCSTSVRGCQEVETSLFRNIPWKEVHRRLQEKLVMFYLYRKCVKLFSLSTSEFCKTSEYCIFAAFSKDF